MFDLERAKREGAVTRGGLKVRILGELANNEYPIVVAVTGSEGNEMLRTYAINGRWWSYKESGLDLLNLPAERTWFVSSDGCLNETESAAIARVRYARNNGKPAGYARVTIPLTY